jgi:zinc protease
MNPPIPGTSFIMNQNSQTFRPFAPLMAALVLLLTPSIFAAEPPVPDVDEPIPARPEQFRYRPLVYEPPAPDKFRVQLKSGPVAYLVPNRELPLVTVAVHVRVGAYLQPAGKEGLSGIAGSLLAHSGTPSRTAEDLEERLAFLAARLTSAIGDTQGGVTLNLLAKDLDEGLTILREVLATPRFQEDKLTLQKQQQLQGLKTRNDNSAAIESREAGFLAYGDTFWANRYPTAASVQSITREDLQEFHKLWFHPANFVVAASGDFDREQMVKKLDALFADWPFKGQTPPPVPADGSFAAAGLYLVDKDVNQGRVTMMLPGIRRDDPDYFAGMVMNDILGGGGFSSRIMSRVRSDEGLAYHAGSSFPGGVYYPLTLSAAFQSKSRSVALAASLVLDEMKKLAAEPVSDTELNTAKRGFIDTFPRNFTTKDQVAGTFAQDELTGRYARDPQFWNNYRSRVEAVSKADILRVAKKYLTPQKLVILAVGSKRDILAGDPDRPVKLTQLTQGPLVDVPLRDPLTLKLQPIR